MALRCHALTAVVEHWVIHDGSHAWSGILRAFADDAGPHASAQTLRLFLARKCGGCAS